MKKLTLDLNHILKREKQIKARIRIAESYLNSNSRDFWREAEQLRGRKRCPSAAVEGLTNGDDIADAFSRYYDDLYNSVDFDHSEMRRGGSRMVGAVRQTMWWGPFRRSA